jgi:hypothetical protein
MKINTATEAEIQKCKVAISKLAQLCVNDAVFPEGLDELYAWGQYLDTGGQFSEAEVQGQFGIYGSCAALQILSTHNFPEYTEYVRGGLLALPLVARDENISAAEKIHHYYESKGDLATTYKLAALHDISVLVKSLDGGDEFHADPPAVARKLVSLARPGVAGLTVT